ncbi:hypothetical protein [Rhodocaloribacter sp.]
MKKDIFAIMVLAIIMTSCYMLFFKGDNKRGNDHQEALYLDNIRLNWIYNGSEFPRVKMKNTINNNEYLINNGAGYSIIIIIGKSGCKPCQIRELKNLSLLYKDLGHKVSFYAIYYNEKHVEDKADRLEALQFRKLGHVAFPVLYTNNTVFGHYMTKGEVPMVFVLKNMTVVSTYRPTPESKNLSHIFAEMLLRNTNLS